MKLLSTGLMLATLSFSLIGCGKDNKSGGGSLPNFSNTNLPLTSQENMTSLSSWYNGTTEGTKALGLMKIEKIQSEQSSQNCSTIDLKLFKIPYCIYTQSNIGPGTVLSTSQQTLLNDGAKISSRGNPELQEIFSQPQNVVQAVRFSQTEYRVSILINNTITDYTINTSYHSMLNPVQKYQAVQSTGVINTKATCINPFPANYPGGCSIY